MDTILCILLNLNVISSPGTYNISQIDSLEQVFSLTINNTKNNLSILNSVLAEYLPELNGITIIDNGSLR